MSLQKGAFLEYHVMMTRKHIMFNCSFSGRSLISYIYKRLMISEFHSSLYKILEIFSLMKSLTTVRRFGNLKQYCPSLQVSDFETGKVNVVDVVFGFAKIICDVKYKHKLMLGKIIIAGDSTI